MKQSYVKNRDILYVYEEKSVIYSYKKEGKELDHDILPLIVDPHLY